MKLLADHISKRFDENPVLKEVSFQITEGEFVSVIGPSGAGKTTLMRILNGMEQPDGGSIFMDEDCFTDRKGSRKRSLQKRIGTIYQDFCLVEQVSCLQNVLNACLPDMGFVRAAMGLFTEQQKTEAMALLTRVGLQGKAEETVKNLSGGQKQRVAIARALMRHPDLLLADEPVASLDPVTGQQILELLSGICRDSHVAVLMNSHNVAQSRAFSDRILGLSAGRLVYDGPPAGLDETALTGIYGQLPEEKEDH